KHLIHALEDVANQLRACVEPCLARVRVDAQNPPSLPRGRDLGGRWILCLTHGSSPGGLLRVVPGLIGMVKRETRQLHPLLGSPVVVVYDEDSRRNSRFGSADAPSSRKSGLLRLCSCQRCWCVALPTQLSGLDAPSNHMWGEKRGERLWNDQPIFGNEPPISGDQAPIFRVR